MQRDTIQRTPGVKSLPTGCRTAAKGGNPQSAKEHQRQDPECLLHGCSSQNKRDIQEFIKKKRIDQAVRQAFESAQVGPPEPASKGSSSTTTTSSTTRPSPPPLRRSSMISTVPPPPPLRRSNVVNTAARLRPRRSVKAP